MITNNPLKITIPSTVAQHGGGTAQHGAKHSWTREARHGTTSRPAPSFPPSSSSHSCAVLRHHHQVQVFDHQPNRLKTMRTEAVISARHRVVPRADLNALRHSGRRVVRNISSASPPQNNGREVRRRRREQQQQQQQQHGCNKLKAQHQKHTCSRGNEFVTAYAPARSFRFHPA